MKKVFLYIVIPSILDNEKMLYNKEFNFDIKQLHCNLRLFQFKLSEILNS